MENFIGIDISKEELVIFHNNDYFTINNTTQSIEKWYKKNKLTITSNDLWVYEATGGYERTLAHFIDSQQLLGRCVHANHVRAYAKSKGLLAKTDNIDANTIAEFAQVMKLEAKPTVHEHEELSALVRRREQYVKLRAQETSRVDTVISKAIIEDIKGHISDINSRIKSLEKEIKKYVKANKELANIVSLLESIPGVGLLTAVGTLVYMPELTELTEKEAASLAGLAPMNKDSGRQRGKRKIQGGRAAIRRLLYMASMTAIIKNEAVEPVYTRLRNKGKLYKVAIVAAMRKLLLIIRAVLLRGTPWVSEPLVSK